MGEKINLNLEQESVQEKSVEQKERELQQRMVGFQLKYGIKLMNKEIKFLNGEYVDINSFEDVVKKWTRIPKEIRNAYHWRTGKTEEDAEYKKIFNQIVGEIVRQYEGNSDPDVLSQKVFEIISNGINVLPKSEFSELSLKEQQEHEVGVLGYNVFELDADGAKNYGFDSAVDCIDLHFDSLFWQKAQPGKGHLTRENLPEEIKKSCAQLAEIIKKKYPNVVGITGLSWLLDAKWFAGAVGFDSKKSILFNDGFSKGNGFWGQFISASGELKEDKLKDLLDGKKPKYMTKVNFIPIKDFFKIHAEESK